MEAGKSNGSIPEEGKQALDGWQHQEAADRHCMSSEGRAIGDQMGIRRKSRGKSSRAGGGGNCERSRCGRKGWKELLSAYLSV